MTDNIAALIARADRRGGVSVGEKLQVRAYADTWETITGEALDPGNFGELLAIASGDLDPADDLANAAKAVAEALEALDVARRLQRAAIVRASAAGVSEVAIAREGSVNRMTVRAALGK